MAELKKSASASKLKKSASDALVGSRSAPVTRKASSANVNDNDGIGLDAVVINNDLREAHDRLIEMSEVKGSLLDFVNENLFIPAPATSESLFCPFLLILSG